MNRNDRWGIVFLFISIYVAVLGIDNPHHAALRVLSIIWLVIGIEILLRRIPK